MVGCSFKSLDSSFELQLGSVFIPLDFWLSSCFATRLSRGRPASPPPAHPIAHSVVLVESRPVGDPNAPFLAIHSAPGMQTGPASFA